MADTAYADPAVFLAPARRPWTPAVTRAPIIQRSLFGDIVLVVFLLAQCFDGVFTYVGVMVYGAGIEANPLIAGLMDAMGHGPGLAIAKLAAAALGIALHLRHVHSAVMVLAGFYLVAAIIPWSVILFA
jgi:uncharacterized membrane protein